MREYLAPDEVERISRLAKRLESWPKDRHIDEMAAERAFQLSRDSTQRILLAAMDGKVLRMEGFKYFKAYET